MRRVPIAVAGAVCAWIAVPGGAGGQQYPMPTTPPTSTTPTPVAPPAVLPPAPAQTPKSLPLLSPFPIIRIVGRTTPRGARISLLTIRGTVGNYVVSRCIGARGRCPYQQRTARIAGRRGQIRTFHVRAFERSFRAGVVLRVYVVDTGRTGKFTSFKIHSKRAPRRNDGCIADVLLKPVSCPSG